MPWCQAHMNERTSCKAKCQSGSLKLADMLDFSEPGFVHTTSQSSCEPSAQCFCMLLDHINPGDGKAFGSAVVIRMRPCTSENPAQISYRFNYRCRFFWGQDTRHVCVCKRLNMVIAVIDISICRGQ